jgi:probable HAF family extracellular repeat protein
MRKPGHRLLLCFASIVIVLQTFATLTFGQTSEPSSYTFATVDVPLPDRQLGFTSFQDINDRGQIVGAFTNSDLGPYGFLLNFKKKVRSTEIRCPGKDVVSTAPQSINGHGEIAGFATVVVERIKIPQPPHKILITEIKGFFRDRGGKCTIIDFPGANLTEATGVNDGGQVVGDYRDANTGIFHGFLWDAGQFLTIDVPFPETSLTGPSGINNVGQIVGFYDDDNVGNRRGFLYDNGIFTSFDFPDAVVTLPFDINDNGQIVGLFVVDRGSIARSFVLDDGTFTTFDVPFPGILFTEVRGINNQGQIVGRYVENNPDDPVNPFPSHGFVASPNVNSPLVASLIEDRPLDPKKPNAVPQLWTYESQKVVTTRAADGQLCFFDDTSLASVAIALSKAGLCTTGVTVPDGTREE